MAAKTVTIEEAQTHLPELIALVEQGTEVIIAKGKEPLAKLDEVSAALRRAA